MQETQRPSCCSQGKLRFSFIAGVVAVLLLMFGVFAGNVAAQVMTGSISGTVTDSSGAVIAGAKVELVLTLTGSTRTVTTSPSGDFVFADVPAGTYELHITQTGFKTYNRQNLVLSAQESLSLHQIALEIGNVATQVTVSANAARVETQSSGTSGLVTDTQIANVPNKGRNYMDYLQLLPGTNGSPGGHDAPGWGQGGVTFNGGDAGTVLVLLNGIASQDTGAPGAPAFFQPSTDSVQELKVQTGVQSAEYGGRAGGTVNVVTKNGTSEFHGNVFWYNRNNFYNANDYFRKENGDPAISQHPAPYKFNDFGGTIGGPILLPGGINKSRQRAFFFFSTDNLRRTQSGNLTFMTTPTPAERGGFFTNLTQNLVNPGGALPICTGLSPNITCSFPSAAMDPAGSRLMNVLPMPTCLRAGDSTTGLNSSLAGLPACSDNNHNFNYVNSFPYPWYNNVLRTDFKLSNNELFYMVLQLNREERQGFTGFLGGQGAWPQSLSNYLIRSRAAMGSLISTLSPTVVNELTVGTNYAIQTTFANSPEDLSRNNRSVVGVGPSVLPVLFPDPNNGDAQSLHVNPYDLIPYTCFGRTPGFGSPCGTNGVTSQNALVGGSNTPGAGILPNAPAMGFESRYPFYGTDWDWTFTDNLSWVKGNHSLKFGIFYEHVSRSTPTYSNIGGADFNGVLEFQSTGVYSSTNASGSPLDTGNSFANAYVGAFARYAEDNTRWVSHGVNHDLEWFAEDTWRVTRRLTFNAGIRFTIMEPDYLRDGQLVSQFTPELYSAAEQPALVQPCLNGSIRVGELGGIAGEVACTGTVVSASAIGLYDPNTYRGDVPPYSGMLQGKGYVYHTPNIGLGPRFGFAWDVFGNGKMAVRGGFGMFYDRTSGIDDVLTKADQPPLILSPALFNGTVPQLRATTSRETFLGPQNIAGNEVIFSMPQVYNYSLGIQRDMSHGILLNATYLGNVSRHFRRNYQYNGLAYGQHFVADYQDPTSGTGTPYIDNIIRCIDETMYCGYANATFSPFNANSNYNSLQASVTKRFGANFSGGASYTWSKVLNYDGCCDTHILPVLPEHYYYGPSSNDRRQNLTVNWHYNLPSPFSGRFSKAAFNGWSIEGIASFISGSPNHVIASYSGTDPNGGGGPVGAVIVGDLVQSRSSTTSFLNDNAVVAAPNGPGVCQFNQPDLCGLGNSSPRKDFTNPGTNNWNLSLLKQFQLGSNEARYLQFRWETYNSFNHPQFSAPSARASFRGAGGGSVTNTSSYGQITSLAVPSRVMVLALKLYF